MHQTPSSESASQARLSSLRLLVVAILLSIAGCAPMQNSLKNEPSSVASRLGFPDCKVSIPVRPAQIIEDAKSAGNPSPEQDPDWIAILEDIMPGDQLRVIDCLETSRSTYFYALVRENEVIRTFHSSMFD